MILKLEHNPPVYRRFDDALDKWLRKKLTQNKPENQDAFAKYFGRFGHSLHRRKKRSADRLLEEFHQQSEQTVEALQDVQFRQGTHTTQEGQGDATDQVHLSIKGLNLRVQSHFLFL
ncbi:hypothetical protein GWI33_022395 [Rhynchophorus ferrugineus]|uniref:Uncharacterized protein n=1 Tax=Rhynchophorus ferrugineus TaxID=354439 RepID=A0A834IUN4_RHYFE|nr:hypothetical protein GWI33_022395 [Rhynchophorus ferrugineus]